MSSKSVLPSLAIFISRDQLGNLAIILKDVMMEWIYGGTGLTKIGARGVLCWGNFYFRQSHIQSGRRDDSFTVNVVGHEL